MRVAQTRVIPVTPVIRNGGGTLAAGYAVALAVHEAEAIENSLSPEAAQHIRDSVVVVPAGQLSEWALDDIKDETSGLRG